MKKILLLTSILAISFSSFGQGFINDDSTVIAISTKDCKHKNMFIVDAKTKDTVHYMNCHCPNYDSYHYFNNETHLCDFTALIPYNGIFIDSMKKMYNGNCFIQIMPNEEWISPIRGEHIEFTTTKIRGVELEAFVYRSAYK